MDFPNKDNIRPPDKIICDQLVDDTRSDFDKQVEEAMYLSIQENLQQNELTRKYEEDIIHTYYNETIYRKDIFHNLLFELNKLIKIDKKVKEVYEIIEPIIHSYCNQSLTSIDLTPDIHAKIFKVIKTIRPNNINKKSIELLNSIIVCSYL